MSEDTEVIAVGKAKPQVIEDDEHQRVFERVAAVDVAKASGMVCVRGPGADGRRRASRVWEVTAVMGAVTGLGRELARDGIEMVTLETTSDYWRIWYYVLEMCGLAVQLVDPTQARAIKGRPKTDKLDAMWLARLTEWGMLRPCFVPPAPIRVLRDYARARTDLVHERTRCWQRLEKLLEDALVKLSSVASKLTTVSARDMIAAMIAGERDPAVLAGLARTRMKARHADLVAALDGMFDSHHGDLAQLELDQIAFLDQRISWAEDKITAVLAGIPAAWGIDADGSTGPDAGNGPDAAVLPAVRRLAEIHGVTVLTAAQIIAEIGLDMARFPTAAHLVSWTGLCPIDSQSGRRHGKRKDTATPPCAATSARPPPAPPAPTPSSANATGASPAAAARPEPRSPWPAPSWSSSGTCSPTPKPGTPTSATATTRPAPTKTGGSGTTSGRSKHCWATPSPSRPRPP